MADVSKGPVSTMPGACSSAADGVYCDNHPDRAAVARIQGETDSFGCEYLDLCQECVNELRAFAALDRIGVCDWCKQEATDLRPSRDYDEGMSGPVYEVCGACVRRDNERAYAELEANGRYDEGWDDE